jgi:protein gp37
MLSAFSSFYAATNYDKLSVGPLPNLDLQDIDWVIVGGESGPGARPMDPSWVTDLRDQCQQAKIPFFFKQWGGVHKGKTGRMLEGRIWD